jgi:hypothetical protein
MLARRRDQRGDALDELQGREEELGTSVGTRLWQVVDQPVPIQLLDPLRGERRSGTITQQPHEPAPVMRFDARGCIQGESAAVVPLFHVPALVLVQDPAPYESAQDAAADLGLYRLGICNSASIDVWLGPKAPEGMEPNWGPDYTGTGWNLVLWLYGALEPWLDHAWRPGKIELQP